MKFHVHHVFHTSINKKPIILLKPKSLTQRRFISDVPNMKYNIHIYTVTNILDIKYINCISDIISILFIIYTYYHVHQ